MNTRKPKGVIRNRFYNYILDSVETDFFQEEISRLRNKFGIPSDGYKQTDKLWICPPKEWCKKQGKHIQDKHRELQMELWELASYYEIKKPISPHPFEDYIFYNELNPKDENEDWDSLWSLFCATDKYALEKNFSKITADAKEPKEKDVQARYNRRLKQMIREYPLAQYPVAILVHPYASEREIVQYIKTEFKNTIEPLQKKFQRDDTSLSRIKSLRVKDPKIQLRDNFIYKHRKQKSSAIKERLKNELGILLGSEEISAIKSREIKRRKFEI